MHSVKWETKYIMTIGTVNSGTMLRRGNFWSRIGVSLRNKRTV